MTETTTVRSSTPGLSQRRLEQWPSSATRFGTRHWPFLVLLAVGAVLRVVTLLAYRPALLFYDSTRYLENAAELAPQFRPAGYPVFLRLLPLEYGLVVVPVAQHLIGLGMGVLIYVLLQRLGARRWLATLATAPVLLDSFQLNLEQQILSEVLFQLLLLGGTALLVWRRRPGIALASLAGLFLAAAVLTRTNALLAIVPAVLAVLFLKAGLRSLIALVTLFVLPLGGYAFWFHSVNGSYALSGGTGRFLYARVATFVDCRQLSLPAPQRALCPPQPLAERYSPNRYMWSEALSPYYLLDPPPGRTRKQVANAFSQRVIRDQPLAFTRAVVADFLRGFALSRTSRLGDPPVDNWRFQPTYPVFRRDTAAVVAAYGDGAPVADRRLAAFLQAYQRFGNTPGPLLFAALLAGFAASLGSRRLGDPRLRTAAFLFPAVAVAVLLSAAVPVFSWRYQLPQLVLLPPAAALALTAVSRSAATRGEEAHTAPSAGLAGISAWVGRVPLPVPLRRLAADHSVRITKYFLGSVIAGLITVVTFVATFGPGLLGSKGASLTASAVGAVANYFLNRNWAWGRRGRAQLRAEIIPYWLTVIATAVAVTIVTSTVNAIVLGITADRGIRTVVNATAFVSTYAALFLLKYVVFDRLFDDRRRPDRHQQHHAG